MARVPSLAGQSSQSPPPHLAIFGFGLLYALRRSHPATQRALRGEGAVARPSQSRSFGAFDHQAADAYAELLQQELPPAVQVVEAAPFVVWPPASPSSPSGKLWLRAALHTPGERLRHLACFQRL